MSLAGRFCYMGGRVLSSPGRVGAFTPSTIMPKTQEHTGPFQKSPTRRQTGYTEYGDVAVSLWGTTDIEGLAQEVREGAVLENLLAYGWDTDAIGSPVDMVNALKIGVQPKTDPAAFTQFDLTMTSDPDGVLHGVSLHALEAESGDGDTEGSAVDNGYAAAAVAIASSSVANPSVITTSAAHGLQTGDTVEIAGHSGSTPDINGNHVVTVVTTTTFTIAVNVTTGGTGGTCRRSSTRGGGTADLHVSALDRDSGDGLQVDVLDSPDGATFATLDSFTELTSDVDGSDESDGASERISWTGDTDRHLAIAYSYTGTPGGSESATFAVFAARNE